MRQINKLWFLVFAAIGASWLNLQADGIAVVASSALLPVLLLPMIGIGAKAAVNGAPRSRSVITADIIHGVALFATISFAGALASYAVAADSAGWYDDDLVRLDRVLGFHWVEFYQFYARHPLLIVLGRTAYSTIALSPILIIAGLSCMNRPDRIDRLLRAFSIVLSLTMAIFAFMPLQGAFAALIRGVPDYAPITRQAQAIIIAGLRDGTTTSVDLRTLTGIISFPSIHTAAGVLFAWAAWPIRVYRIPMIVINVLMIAATPIEGAHYLADLAGGSLLAWCAIALTGVRWAALLPLRPLGASHSIAVSPA